MRRRPCLTLDDAHKMMHACKAEAARNKWEVTIAIVEEAGYLMLLEPPPTRARSRPTLPRQGTQRSPHSSPDQILGGAREGVAGVPRLSGGWTASDPSEECVGAIGVSAVESSEDEQIAQAGIAALG